MAKKKLSQCKCIDAINRALVPRNAKLAITVSLTTGRAYPDLSLEKINPKARGSLPTLVPTFCPFCGAAYPRVDAKMPPLPIVTRKSSVSSR